MNIEMIEKKIALLIQKYKIVNPDLKVKKFDDFDKDNKEVVLKLLNYIGIHLYFLEHCKIILDYKEPYTNFCNINIKDDNIYVKGEDYIYLKDIMNIYFNKYRVPIPVGFKDNPNKDFYIDLFKKYEDGNDAYAFETLYKFILKKIKRKDTRDELYIKYSILPDIYNKVIDEAKYLLKYDSVGMTDTFFLEFSAYFKNQVCDLCIKVCDVIESEKNSEIYRKKTNANYLKKIKTKLKKLEGLDCCVKLVNNEYLNKKYNTLVKKLKDEENAIYSNDKVIFDRVLFEKGNGSSKELIYSIYDSVLPVYSNLILYEDLLSLDELLNLTQIYPKFDGYREEFKKVYFDILDRYNTMSYDDLVKYLYSKYDRYYLYKLAFENKYILLKFETSFFEKIYNDILIYEKTLESSRGSLIEPTNNISITESKDKEEKNEDNYWSLYLKSVKEEEIKQAQHIIQKFIEEPERNIDIFCKKNNISNREFENYLKLIEEYDTVLYYKYSFVIKNLQSKRYAIIKSNCRRILDFMKYGVELEDGSKRDFDMVDYYSLTSLTFDEVFELMKKEMSADDVRAFRKFANNNNNFLKVWNKTDIENCYNTKIIVAGRELTIEEKEKIIAYLRYLKVPLMQKTFTIIQRRYLNGLNIDLPESELPKKM